jgi:cytochrome bd-type quinol oxidase subunit 1
MTIIAIILLILAIPIGYLIAWLARDELVDGRKWFYSILIASALLSVLFAKLGYEEATIALAFIAIVSFISIIKSKDKKWTKKRI